ncbi:coiled-coil domain-containing protein 174 [Hetaerina americana]|uniref:coiled-coil domain-containing protein 174 n=1 Tax=Hetaerina americana TaxID=62018 RepID=UPI003A7F139A
MKSSKKIEVFSKSALVSLKAELSKKQEEARQARLKGNGETVVPTQIPQKISEYNRKNHGVDERNQKDAEQIAEEEASCRKSRVALEEKAKLYEKLSHGQEIDSSENDGRYLVDFEQKAIDKGGTSTNTDHAVEIDEEEEEEKYDSDDYDHPSDPEEDWVDYRDCLGRTRRCLRKDLPFVKMKDSKLADSLGMSAPPIAMGKPVTASKEASKPESETVTASDTSRKVEPPRENLELMSEDMRKQEMREKWEQQEAELREKSDVHYQDVIFDEVRTYGAGYYAFSTEEKSRQAEQEELRKLRVETEKGQAAASDLRSRRQEQMAARLKAARARKRAREGLPPEPDGDEETAVEGTVEDDTVTMWPDCKAVEMVKAEEEERERRKAKIEGAEEKRRKRLEKRPLPVRPWDIGKEGVSGATDPMSQEEWVKKKREERQDEFAPPPEYNYEDTASSEDLMATDSGWSASHLRATSKKSLSFGGNSRGSNKWKKGNVNAKHIPLDATHGNIDKQLNDEASIERKGVERRGPEIAPPTTFEYYGPSTSKQKLQPTKRISQTSLDDAISAGLSYIRQQAEERDKQKEKGLLDII